LFALSAFAGVAFVLRLESLIKKREATL